MKSRSVKSRSVYRTPAGLSFYQPSDQDQLFRTGPCEACGVGTRWVMGMSPTCGSACADRLEALRRLRGPERMARYLGSFPSDNSLWMAGPVPGDTVHVDGQMMVYTGEEWRKLEAS